MTFINALFKKNYRKSYSQCGEDLIVDFILLSLDIRAPSYLDIGAHHPSYLSNTYLFYKRGSKGICIEPDPGLYNIIKNKRRRDICLNVGVGIAYKSKVDFYIMSSRTLNTFSKEEAERYQSYGNQKIEKIVQISLLPINEIIRLNMGYSPNYVSLDVEGLDFEILQSFDFSIYRPEVFCVETLTYTENKSERKINEIIEFMQSKDYLLYADTYINTIFVDKKSWLER